jgi:uncharacterized coiled-coil protein SlyX
MHSINGKGRRWDRKGLVQHHGTPRLQVVPEIALERPVTDPLSALVGAWGESVQKAVIETVGPILAERDQVIADLREELRLERIRSDQADRLHARLDRARERQIAELKQESEAQERHVEYLRAQLADSQSVDRLASAIVSAMPDGGAMWPQVVREAVPPPPAPAPVTPVTPPPPVPVIVKVEQPPPTELELLRNERGEITGARRKPLQARQEPLPLDQWPVPEA